MFIVLLKAAIFSDLRQVKRRKQPYTFAVCVYVADIFSRARIWLMSLLK